MKTKKIFFTVCILHLISCTSFAQVQNWQWAKSAGGSAYDVATSVAGDANGNIIVGGNFEGAAITFGSTTLTNAGSSDIYIVKYDASGSVLWAKKAGGSSEDFVSSVSTDINGNILIAGYFRSASITFGSTILTNAGSGSSYNKDMFIAKYDPQGNVLWAKRAGGVNTEAANSVATDAYGNIVVCGFFSTGPITFGTITLNNSGLHDAFLVKYDSSGNILWAKKAGGSDFEQAISLTADANGNIFVSGYFNSVNITFGSVTLNNPGLNSYDIFLVKYDELGNVIWAKSAEGCSNFIDNISVTADANGNATVAGVFNCTLLSFDSITLTGLGNKDMFIAKYDASGNVLWAKSVGGANTDGAHSIASDISGNILVTGYFASATITFGSEILTNASSVNQADLFIVKYDTQGNVLWSKSVGGTSTDAAHSISTDVNNNILLVGTFKSSTITFGSTTLTNASVGSDYDMFIAKLDADVTTGEDEQRIENRILIYPNPTNGIFNLQVPSSNYLQTIEIYNMLGEEIFHAGVNSLKSEIDLGFQPNGIYFVKVKTDNKSITQKIVIQK